MTDQEIDVLVHKACRLQHIAAPGITAAIRIAFRAGMLEAARIAELLDTLTITDAQGKEHHGCGIPADPESAIHFAALEKAAKAIRQAAGEP